MVACPGRHADKRKVAPSSGSGHERHRAVAPSHPQGVGTALNGGTQQRLEDVALGQDDYLDPEVVGLLGEPKAGGDSVARPGVDD